MIEEETELRACLDQFYPKPSAELQTALEKLNSITAARDSLSLMRAKDKSLPGTSPRLSLLEKRREQLIKDLHQQVCNRKSHNFPSITYIWIFFTIFITKIVIKPKRSAVNIGIHTLRKFPKKGKKNLLINPGEFCILNENTCASPFYRRICSIYPV